jgi:His/Glu/Gln/Arg/opine family amino acid ABC transporter permease subunit
LENIISVLVDALPSLLTGLQLTLLLSVISLGIATVIGLISGLMSLAKNPYISGPARLYVNVIRGTPLLVQILFIYFGLPTVLHINLTPITAGVIAVSLHVGAYVSEVFRAGIESVDVGQTEASRSLGLSQWQAMRKIILPQATRRMVPPMINQFIMGVKDTSLLAVIGVAELTQQGQSVYAVNYRAFEILTVVALIYLVVTYTLYRVSRVIERRYVI